MPAVKWREKAALMMCLWSCLLSQVSANNDGFSLVVRKSGITQEKRDFEAEIDRLVHTLSNHVLKEVNNVFTNGSGGGLEWTVEEEKAPFDLDDFVNGGQEEVQAAAKPLVVYVPQRASTTKRPSLPPVTRRVLKRRPASTSKFTINCHSLGQFDELGFFSLPSDPLPSSSWRPTTATLRPQAVFHGGSHSPSNKLYFDRRPVFHTTTRRPPLQGLPQLWSPPPSKIPGPVSSSSGLIGVYKPTLGPNHKKPTLSYHPHHHQGAITTYKPTLPAQLITAAATTSTTTARPAPWRPPSRPVAVMMDGYKTTVKPTSQVRTVNNSVLIL